MTNSNKPKSETKDFQGKFSYRHWSDGGEILHIAHATGLCSGVYTQFAKLFTNHFKVVGLDFRGHGKTSAAADSKYLKNWEVFVDDLERFFRHFNQPLVAIGHSMGGTISAMLAARNPNLVSKLILIEPGFMPPLWRPFVYFVQKTGLSMHVPFVTKVTKRTSHWHNRSEVLSEIHGKGPFRSWRQEILTNYIDEGTEPLDDGTIRLRCNPTWEGRILATAPCGIWTEVSCIKVPTLVIYGEKSRTFLPSVAKRIKTMIPHAILKELPETGHFIPMECPEQSAELILTFLQQGTV